jgi:hypothetical protein
VGQRFGPSQKTAHGPCSLHQTGIFPSPFFSLTRGTRMLAPPSSFGQSPAQARLLPQPPDRRYRPQSEPFIQDSLTYKPPRISSLACLFFPLQDTARPLKSLARARRRCRLYSSIPTTTRYPAAPFWSPSTPHVLALLLAPSVLSTSQKIERPVFDQGHLHPQLLRPQLPSTSKSNRPARACHPLLLVMPIPAHLFISSGSPQTLADIHLWAGTLSAPRPNPNAVSSSLLLLSSVGSRLNG